MAIIDELTNYCNFEVASTASFHIYYAMIEYKKRS